MRPGRRMKTFGCDFWAAVFVSGAFRPEMWRPAVLGSVFTHRVCKWAGGAGRKPEHQSGPDQRHHLPAGPAGWVLPHPGRVGSVRVWFLLSFCIAAFYSPLSGSDDASREVLHSSYNLTSTLAAVIHHHGNTPGDPLVLQVETNSSNMEKLLK